MTKPRAIEWLEQETGEKLDRGRAPLSEGKHLSMRVPADLGAELEAYAIERGESVSQVARRLIAEGLARIKDPDRGALDNAIAVLESMKDLDRRRAG